MSLNLNPMGLGGAIVPNVQQPNVGNPVPQAAVATYATGSNVLNLSWPIAVYTQPDHGAPATNPAFPLGTKT